MPSHQEVPSPKRFLSLRWKALIALSLVLIVVDGWLTYLINEKSVRQFEIQQSQVRTQQTRQLRAMLGERAQEMSKVASLVPLLGTTSYEALTEQLRNALDTNGALLDLEWDVRSVHWVARDGQIAIAWPNGTPDLPQELLEQIEQSPESISTTLACQPECGQFQAIPLLWQGKFAGSLVLEQSLSDALLAFRALTGAEIAIDLDERHKPVRAEDQKSTNRLQFPVITYPERSLPILHAAEEQLQAPGSQTSPILVRHAGGWFEIYRIEGIARGVNAYVMNEVTAQQQGIREATFNSLTIGILGLLISLILLLFVMRTPLHRLRDLATALPLLGERRHLELKSRLGQFGPRSRLPPDEIDVMVETVERLNDRMELLQQDRDLAEEQLIWLADHDPLTRLMNRRRFHEDFERILDQALRYSHVGALLFLDLDEFKDVNDMSGHQVGDALLQRVAEELRGLARSSDLLARLGGDEFALVLPESTREGAIEVAEKLLEAVRGVVLREQGRQHRISASIGIVIFPDQGQDIPQLLASADLAMYQAKHFGRGRWHIFSEQDPVREQLDARILWKDQIADALRLDRFELHFQPIIELATGQTKHFEALLRMVDARGTLIYPQQFIGVAERTGQIQGIDHWLLRNAVRLLAERPDLRVAINLSGNAMDDPTILTVLKRLLSQQNLQPSRLTFEITETAAINSLSSATRLMRSIQELGCRFALDDFGSGYASYAYLRQLPVDDIKIDGAFVRELPHNREDRIFVKAITDMAHGMGKRVIAEFVETAEILAVLEEIGVDCGQGYFFARPAPLPSLPAEGLPEAASS